jgi:tetratricopeptide (TPR) repeat protein
MTFALTAGQELLGPAQADWLDRIQVEHDNLRVALQWLIQKEQLEDVSDMCFALWLFWMIRGYLREGQHWTDEALGRPGTLNAAGRAQLLFTAGGMLHAQGRYQDAAATLDEAVALARQAGDSRVCARALTLRGQIAVIQGQPKLAAVALDEAETLSRGLGELVAATLAAATRAVISRGELSEGDRRLSECEAEVRELRLPWVLAVALDFHGWITLLQGGYSRAETMLCEAVIILGRLQDFWAMMHCLTLLADVAAVRAKSRRAARLYGAADGLNERSGVVLFHFYRDHTERCRAKAIKEIGIDTFDALRQAGRTLTLDEVVALAVNASDNS